MYIYIYIHTYTYIYIYTLIYKYICTHNMFNPTTNEDSCQEILGECLEGLRFSELGGAWILAML